MIRRIILALVKGVPREDYIHGLQERQSKIVRLRDRLKQRDSYIAVQQARIDDLKDTCRILSKDYDA